MFLFQFVKHIIETVIEIYEIFLIWWVDPQYPWSQGIGSPIWGSSMTRVNSFLTYSHVERTSDLTIIRKYFDNKVTFLEKHD